FMLAASMAGVPAAWAAIVMAVLGGGASAIFGISGSAPGGGRPAPSPGGPLARGGAGPAAGSTPPRGGPARRRGPAGRGRGRGRGGGGGGRGGHRHGPGRPELHRREAVRRGCGARRRGRRGGTVGSGAGFPHGLRPRSLRVVRRGGRRRDRPLVPPLPGNDR